MTAYELNQDFVWAWMKSEVALVAEVDGYWNVYAHAHEIHLTNSQKISVDFSSHVYEITVDELLVPMTSQIH